MIVKEMGRGGDNSVKKSEVKDGSSLIYGPASPPPRRVTINNLNIHPGIYAELHKAGVDVVEVEFSGHSEEAYVEEGQLFDKNSKTINGYPELEEKTSQFVASALEQNLRGWADDEGAYGTATIFVNKGQTEVDCYNRYIDFDDAPFSCSVSKDIEELANKVGAKSVEIYFNGYGDDGGIEDVTIEDSKGNDLARGETSEDVEKLVQRFSDLVYQRLSHERSGWEINEGSSGSINWKPGDKQVEFSFAWRTEVAVHEPFSLGQLSEQE